MECGGSVYVCLCVCVSVFVFVCVYVCVWGGVAGVQLGLVDNPEL